MLNVSLRDGQVISLLLTPKELKNKIQVDFITKKLSDNHGTSIVHRIDDIPYDAF